MTISETPYFVITLVAPSDGSGGGKFYNAIWSENDQWINFGALGSAGTIHGTGYASSNSVSDRSALISKVSEKAAGKYNYVFHSTFSARSSQEFIDTARTILEDPTHVMREVSSFNDAIQNLNAKKWENNDGSASSDTGDEPLTVPAAAAFRSRIVVDVHGRDYHTREVMFGADGIEDVTLVQKFLANSMYLLMESQPGTGKSALIAASVGEHYLVVGTEETSYAELYGGWAPDGEGSYKWVDGKVTKAALEGKTCFIDEVAMIPSTLLTGLYSAMDGRGTLEVDGRPDEVGGSTVHCAEGFWLCFAYNAGVPGAVVSDALRSRSVNVGFTTNYGLAKKMGVNSKVISISQRMAEMANDPSNEITWAPQFRELLAFKKAEEVFGLSFALAKLISDVPSDYSMHNQDVLIEMLRDKFNEPGLGALKI